MNLVSVLFLIVFTVFLSGCASQLQQASDQQHADFNQVAAAKARVTLALSYLAKRNYQQAKYSLDKAMGYAPTLPLVHYSRGFYFALVGQTEQALAAYEKAYQLAPSDPDVTHNLGSFLCRIGRYAAAESLLLQALQAPTYANAGNSHINLAYCYLSQHKWRLAQTQFELADSYLADSGEARLMLAYLHFAEQNYSEAMADFEKYRIKQKPAPRAWLFCVHLYRTLALSAQAQQCQIKLLQLYPRSIAAKQLKQQAWRDTEHWQLRLQFNDRQLK